jgi:hypothetical protein
MEVTFAHGPDRTPIAVDPDGTVHSAGPTPFHGIVSLGLRRALGDSDAPVQAWAEHAHQLSGPASTTDDPVLRRLRDELRRAGALTFGESAVAARLYAERICSADPESSADACELWNVKEGQISSVWFCTLAPDATRPVRQFVINVARDHEAGLRLRETSALMEEIGQRRPELRMARVLGVAAIELPTAAGPRSVTVTHNELIRDAFELARLPIAGSDQGGYAAVERFLTQPEAPARIRSIRGRILSPTECRRIEDDVARFLAAARSVSPVSVDLERGDLVWNGDHAIVVAVGAG